MIVVRPSQARGHASRGWLDSYHTFSFADYHDRAHMGFRSLRVINEDRVQAASGFGDHPHRDMEILTWVLEGALAHEDSLGNGSVIRPGEIQAMSAGTGIVHSEYNASAEEPVHFLQIWIVPERAGLPPRYEQRAFDAGDRRGRFQLLASRDGRDGSVTVHQEVDLFITSVGAHGEIRYTLGTQRHAWIQIIQGTVTVNGQSLATGDGAAVSDEDELVFRAAAESEFLLFDLR
jgi:hypothetical protein